MTGPWSAATRAARRVAEAYVPYLEGQVEYYEGLSRRLPGYEPRRVMVLHANSINAERFGELAGMMTRRGYAFVAARAGGPAVPDPSEGSHMPRFRVLTPATGLAAALIASVAAPPAHAASITFTSNKLIPADTLTYDGFDVTVSGATLTVEGVHAFASLTLVSSAVLTHSALDSLRLAIAGDLRVDATSRVDASARGYPENQGPGAGTSAFAGTLSACVPPRPDHVGRSGSAGLPRSLRDRGSRRPRRAPDTAAPTPSTAPGSREPSRRSRSPIQTTPSRFPRPRSRASPSSTCRGAGSRSCSTTSRGRQGVTGWRSTRPAGPWDATFTGSRPAGSPPPGRCRS